jgi:Ni/Co efflux regulator RcnB
MDISVARLALHRNATRRPVMKIMIKTVAAVALVAAAFTSIGTGGEALARDRDGSRFEGYHGDYHFQRDHDHDRYDRRDHDGYYDGGYEGCRYVKSYWHYGRGCWGYHG